MAAKTALITGITGQDGAYLANLLLSKGYEVHGLKRRTSLFNTDRIDHLFHDPQVTGVPLELHHGDMTDSSSLISLFNKVKPDEIYNLAAQSHVKVSFEIPEYTANSDALGVLRLLEAVKSAGLIKKTKIFSSNHIVVIHREKKTQDKLNSFIDIILSKQYGRSKIIFGVFN